MDESLLLVRLLLARVRAADRDGLAMRRYVLPIWIGFICCLAVAAIDGSAASSFEQPTVPTLRLAVSVPRPQPLYPVTQRRGFGHVAYVGEPIVLSVSLVNATERDVDLRDPGGWLAALQIDLLTTERQLVVAAIPFEVTGVLNAQRGGPVSSAAIPAGEIQEATLELRPIAPFEPRDYRLRASVAREGFGDLSSVPKVASTAMTALEVTPVQSADDRLNVLYAQGVRARLSKRNDEARRAFQLFLATEPNSTTVWYQLGLTSMQDDNCADAATAFGNARAVMLSRADRAKPAANVEVETMLERDMAEAMKNCGGRRR